MLDTSWMRDVAMIPNGGFIAVGNYNKLWWSADGLKWTDRGYKRSKDSK